MDTVLLLCQGGWTAFLSQGHVKHLFPHTLTYTNGTRLADFHYSDGEERCPLSHRALVFALMDLVTCGYICPSLCGITMCSSQGVLR